MNPSRRSLRALDALNFTFADVQTGVGPYLAIYLVGVRHFDAASVGIATSAAGFATVIAQTPAGAVIDGATFKRTLLAIAACVGGVGAIALAFFPTLWPIVATQVVIGGAFAFVPPGIAAVTLGMVGSAALAKRQGRNQALNAAGNVFFAVVAGALGYFAQLSWIFYLILALGALTAYFALAIEKDDIDDDAAREAPEAKDGQRDALPPFSTMFRNACRDRRIVVLVVVLFLWNLANAAMLVLLGEILPHGGKSGASLYLSAGIVAAQLVMVGAALTVPRFADALGRKPVFAFAMCALIARGVLFAIVGKANPGVLVAVQALDGLGAGVYNVIWLLIVADIAKGTGRFNFLQGIAITGFGLGGALSNLIAGFIAQRFGFQVGFLALAAIAAAALALFLSAMPETKAATAEARR